MRAEPTYATKRSPERYTDGPMVGAAIAQWLGRRPTRWQQDALDVALERLDGPRSPFAYDDVIIIVGRRCGKTVTTFGVPLARALAGPVRLPNGRRMPFKATHTAQNLTAARTRFVEDLVEPYRRRFTDIEWKRGFEFKRGAADTTLSVDPRRGRGKKDLEVARRRQLASEIRVLAPSPSAARGAGVLHLTFDEALTYTLKRGQELSAAARPTMAEMLGHAQTWTVSNISKDTDESTYLWNRRQAGRAAVEQDRRDRICYIEFSLPPGEDPTDERAWWRHYPALGDGIVGIQQLRSDRERFMEENNGSDADFDAEYLCRWPDENDTGLSGWDTLTEADWTAAKTTDPMPDDAPAALGVDIDPFGRSSSIVAATARPDGEPGTMLEVIAHGPGSDWVLTALLERAEAAAAVAIDDYGPGHELLALATELPLLADKLIPMKSQDIIAASYALDAGMREHRILWRASDYYAQATAAASAAQRTTGRAWQWERRVSTSQTPIMAATLAAWALEHAPAPAEFFVY